MSELKPCPSCGGEVTGYSSSSKYIFFMRCNKCKREYPLKTKIVVFKNNATKITKASINKANKEWNANADKLKEMVVKV